MRTKYASQSQYSYLQDLEEGERRVANDDMNFSAQYLQSFANNFSLSQAKNSIPFAALSGLANNPSDPTCTLSKTAIISRAVSPLLRLANTRWCLQRQPVSRIRTEYSL